MMDDFREAANTDGDSPADDHLCRADLAGEGKGSKLRRRTVLKALGSLAVGTLTFRRALAAQAADTGKVTPEMIRQAEWIAGLELTEKERESTAKEVQQSLASFQALRKVELGHDVAPALSFVPAPGLRPADGVRRNQARASGSPALQRPGSDEALAFLTVTELSALIRSRQVTSTELTKLYLGRLKRFDPLLKCVVTLTEDLAIQQAARADAEIAAGKVRGPLHGIPWGAKDLIAVPGYPTTWGAPQFKGRVLNQKATVAARLEEAGAVLVAKLTLGALAQGDDWFGGKTRSPWDPRRGSSGSSAGSAAAAAAGLVGFALGSETLGSIISPCRACGASGLRPTFGRVSRHGCMSLAWSMDKIGPIARSIEDCASFSTPSTATTVLIRRLLISPSSGRPEPRSSGSRSATLRSPSGRPTSGEELKVLRSLGFELVPIALPTNYPLDAITLMLGTEAASAFDELTRNHVTEGLNTWPDEFRQGQFVPAVEYLRAARVRTLLMRAMAKVMESVDLYVGSGPDLVITNLTGHPSAVFPGSFRDINGRPGPRSFTLTGQLYGESTLLAVAHAYQQATLNHLQHPPLEQFLAKDKS